MTQITLRPYQEKGVLDIRKAFSEGHRAVIYTLPTGGGKTVLFTHLAMLASQKGSRVMILVHRDSLFKQTAKTLSNFGVRHGLIGAGYQHDYSKNVQVAKIATVVNRLDKFTPDFIIVDECHHTNAATYKKVLSAYPNAKVLGVTATPCRTDGTGLGETYSIMVSGPTITELIEMGFLVAPRIFCPPVGVDLSGIKKSMGDYSKSELDVVMDKPKITGDVITHYKRLADGLPTVAFCVSVQHATHVSEMFRSQGYRSAVVHGSMPQNEIDTILTGLGTGEIQVVTSCDLISEGTDIPAIGCAILLRPTMSLSLYIQQIGRALRPCAGKSEAIILDHVGNVKRHGHPLSEFEWSLEGVKKKTKSETTESVLKVKECESCYRVFEATADCCPSCGWIPEKKERKLEIVDGELQELLMTERERKEAERERKAAEKQRAEENNRLKKMARTYEELLKLEKQAGYKPGWAWNIFNARKKRK